MNPLRSISMLPIVGSSQGQNFKPFNEATYKDNGKHIQNYQAYDTELSIAGNQDSDISWITDVPNEKMYMEVSFLDKDTQKYVSRKFDFGNFLNYIGNSLRILENGINDIYLTKAEAEEMFLKIGGGVLTGPLTISYQNKTSPALKINATDASGEKCSLQLYGDLEVANDLDSTIVTYNSVNTTELNCKTFKDTGNAEIDGTMTCASLTASGNGSFGGELTCTSLTCSTNIELTGTSGTFNFAGKLKTNTVDGAERIEMSEPLKTTAIINTGNITNNNGTVTTKYLVVNEDTTFTKSVTVGTDLTVERNTTLKCNVDCATEYSATVAGKQYWTHINNCTVNSTALTANVGIFANGNITASGDITGSTIIGTTAIKISDQLKMSSTDGLIATTKISQLTAQYACWA